MPTVKELRLKAKELGMEGYAKLNKAELIHTIQEFEGNQPCYEQIHDCGEFGCLYFSECQIPQEG